MCDHYKTIARHLTSDKGQCVLILGPELSVDRSGQGFKDAFRNMLPPGSESKYLDSVNLFYFEDSLDADLVRSKVIRYYRESGDKPLLEMISRIKFPLIINVCPDKALNDLYTKYHYDFHEGYFTRDSKVEFENLPLPSKNKPVIYNIFGTIDLEQSIILTHSKLYETIEYLLPEKSLPDKIELFLRGIANSFVFLGFRFDSWYYQLVCHKLRIKTSLTDNKTSLSTPSFGDNDTVSVIMRSSFDMKFAEENPFECIQNIISACEEERPGDLRDRNKNGYFSVYISYGRNDEANDQLENIADLIEKEFQPSPTELYQFFRDRKQLKYGDSIDSFMNRIGTGKSVIIVLSDKYLRSVYCMKEALRIYRSEDKEQRVFPILLQDAGQDILKDPEVYKDHWFVQCQTVLKDPTKLEDFTYDDFVSIFRFVHQFIVKMASLVQLRLLYSDITQDHPGEPLLAPGRITQYNDLIKQIKDKLQEDN